MRSEFLRFETIHGFALPGQLFCFGEGRLDGQQNGSENHIHIPSEKLVILFP